MSYRQRASTSQTNTARKIRTTSLSSNQFLPASFSDDDSDKENDASTDDFGSPVSSPTNHVKFKSKVDVAQTSRGRVASTAAPGPPSLPKVLAVLRQTLSQPDPWAKASTIITLLAHVEICRLATLAHARMLLEAETWDNVKRSSSASSSTPTPPLSKKQISSLQNLISNSKRRRETYWALFLSICAAHVLANGASSADILYTLFNTYFPTDLSTSPLLGHLRHATPLPSIYLMSEPERVLEEKERQDEWDKLMKEGKNVKASLREVNKWRQAQLRRDGTDDFVPSEEKTKDYMRTFTDPFNPSSEEEQGGRGLKEILLSFLQGVEKDADRVDEIHEWTNPHKA